MAGPDMTPFYILPIKSLGDTENYDEAQKPRNLAEDH